jgi:1-acyl-sn-glycerol-3-phosphate acyltransferase
VFSLPNGTKVAKESIAMKQLLGIERIVITLIVLLLGVIVILGASLLPIRVQGHRPAAWVAVGLARMFNVIYNVKVIAHHPEMLRRHRGFIFANHQSYLDALAFLSLMPVRFLAAAEVRNYPLVGWIAAAIGTIYVQRADRDSRRQARNELIERFLQEPDPPIVLFPEGKLGPGDQPLPFRHGAFALANEHAVPYLLCAIHCQPLAIAAWRGAQGEGLAAAIWRLARYRAPVQITVEPLLFVCEAPGAEAARLAETALQAIRIALRAAG